MTYPKLDDSPPRSALRGRSLLFSAPSSSSGDPPRTARRSGLAGLFFFSAGEGGLMGDRAREPDLTVFSGDLSVDPPRTALISRRGNSRL